MTIGTKHRIGFKQTAVELVDGSFAQQNFSAAPGTLVGGKIGVTGTAAEIVAFNPGRVSVLLHNLGGSVVYVGGPEVTTANGYPVPGGSWVELATTSAVHGVASSGTLDVRFLELTN